MSDPTVSERRIRPIQDAVASGNWKQALQLADKWWKKGERSDRFLALKAFVLVNQPDVKQHDRGRDEVLDLCKRSPAITDPEAIYQMQHALKALSLKKEEGPRLWERAASAAQDNKDLYTRWLNEAVTDSNWLSAQKATMGLRKSFPKDRNYEFWNIMMCSLIQKDRTQAEKDRQLFGMLAYRMISKAAETIPADQEQVLSTGKAISTPEEVALLSQILNSTGRAAETVKLLRSDALNLESKIGRQDPQLILSLLLQSFAAAELWEEARSFCHSILSKPEYQSDDRIWTLWLKAETLSPSKDDDQSSLKLLDLACAIRPVSRAPYIAKLQYLAAKADEVSLDMLLQTCEDYADAYSTKAFCFDDLKEALQRLDAKRLQTFRNARSVGVNNLVHLFLLKLDYSLLSKDVAKQDLVDIATRSLKLYQASLSEAPACPEAALLAVMAILRLMNLEHSYDVVVRATILLDNIRSAFEDHYQLTVVLIRLQTYLGLFSMGMETFTKLSVKNMQYDTVAHLVLTRISTLHPAHIGQGKEKLDPLEAIDTGLNVLENADGALVRGIREGLRFNSYSNIDNSVDMRAQIDASATRHVYAIDERKIRRLRGLPEDTVLESDFEFLVDNRDLSYFPNYHTADQALIAGFQCGPLPSKPWVDAMTFLDNIKTYLKAELTGQTTITARALENVLKKDQYYATADPGRRQALTESCTEAEIWNLQCHEVLSNASVLLGEGGEVSEDTAKDLCNRLEDWLQQTLADEKSRFESLPRVSEVPILGWAGIHTSITRLETLQAVALLLGLLSKRAKTAKGKAIRKADIAQLQTLVVAVEEQIHGLARKAKEGLNAPGVLGKLVDLGYARDEGAGGEGFEKLGEILEEVCDEVKMETACGRIRDSWEDALDGVLPIKVKIWK